MGTRRMARITTESRTELGFELERFDFTAADRLEVTGRWFGVRGRRFVRPVVNLRVDGRRRRMIAVLDHKPWAADAEGTWIAAFAWRGEHGRITNARIEVAPDVVPDLPAPGDDAAGTILHPLPPRREPRKETALPAEAAPAEPTPPDTPAADVPPAEPTPPDTPAADVAPADAAPPAEAVPPPVEAAPPEPPPPAAPAATAAALRDAERRLAEERATRERLEAALQKAEARVAALSEHHESAVERANDLVRLEGELAAAREHIERVERDRLAAQQRGDAAEHRLAAFRERAETAERELAAAGDVAALRRRAETAERELAAARERADAAQRDAAAARERAEAASPRPHAEPHDHPRTVPEAMLAARGVAPRRERGWAARAVGLVWIGVLLIVLLAIVQLVL